ALRRLDGLFERMYAPNDKGGRPSIAPEKLARAMLLQVFYSILNRPGNPGGSIT
ncbi:transposase, partial [Xanthomonas oryzae pv. oryzae]